MDKMLIIVYLVIAMTKEFNQAAVNAHALKNSIILEFHYARLVIILGYNYYYNFIQKMLV